MTNNLCKTLKDFSVVDLDAYVDAEFCKYLIYNLYKLKLIDKGFAANYVYISLVELPVASFLRTVCSPNWLYLLAFERECKLVLVLHHVSCKRYCKVISQAFLTHFQ